MEEKTNKYKKKKILSAQLYKAESAFFFSLFIRIHRTDSNLNEGASERTEQATTETGWHFVRREKLYKRIVSGGGDGGWTMKK